MERIKRMSLKKALFTLTLVDISGAVILSALAFLCCVELRAKIVPEGVMIDPSAGLVVILPQASSKYIGAVLEILQFTLPVLIFICSSFLTAALFYRLKLKKPVAVLTEGANRIIARDLDFTVAADTDDELGRLCTAFETMRQTLLKSNKELWRQTEERKQLNAAFAHELRNPITVLKGAAKLANQGIKKGSIRPEQLEENLKRIEEYTRRIEEYADKMSGVQRLEQISLGIGEVSLGELAAEIENTARLMGASEGKNIVFECKGERRLLSIDRAVILEVAENLISNAVRFAEDTVHISCSVNGGILEVAVSDDGKGFPPYIIKNGIKPFQKGDETDGHFGMGLYICSLLCQKHGGSLKIKNNTQGAVVRAIVKISSGLRDF